VFEKELRAKAESLDYEIDKIDGNPIDGLISYYSNENK